MLESDDFSTILAELEFTGPSSSDYTEMRLGFLCADVAEEIALGELRQAVGLLVERPALQAALVKATERLAHELTDEAYAEQQRLLKRKLEFDARLRQMSGALAATASAGGHGK